MDKGFSHGSSLLALGEQLLASANWSHDNDWKITLLLIPFHFWRIQIVTRFMRDPETASNFLSPSESRYGSDWIPLCLEASKSESTSKLFGFKPRSPVYLRTENKPMLT